jgi:hypothetical protein
MYCHKKNLYCGSPWFKIFGPSELISFWTPLKLRQLSATEIESSMDNTESENETATPCSTNLGTTTSDRQACKPSQYRPVCDREACEPSWYKPNALWVGDPLMWEPVFYVQT